MKKIVDFEKNINERFYRWAGRFIVSTAGKVLSEYPVEHVLCKLVTSGIFTLEEIREKLNSEKIPLHQIYFDKAAWLIENMGKGN